MADTNYGRNISWTSYTPTVTLVGGSGNTVPVYSTNSGMYFRIGNLVMVQFLLSGDGGAEGAGTGQLSIQLPFNKGSLEPGGYVPIGYVTNGSTDNTLIAEMGASNTILLYRIATIGTLSSLTGANQNNTTRTMNGQFFYRV